MKKLILLFLILLPLTASAVWYNPFTWGQLKLGGGLTTFQGGTGTTSPSGILYGDGTIGLKTVDIGNNLTFSGGILTATGGTGTFAWTSQTWGVSTSTTLGFLNGFLSTASSTISSNLYLPSLSQGFAYIGSVGKVNSIASSSIALSWFNNDAGFITSAGSGTVSTSTNETSGRLSYWTSNSGTPALLGEVATTTLTASAPLSLDNPVAKVGGSNSVLTCATASGSVAGCLSATDWTTFNNKAGFAYPFPSAATSTPLTFTGLFTTTNATTTLLSANYASSTLFYGANLTACNTTTEKLLWSGGTFSCGTDAGAGGGITSLNGLTASSQTLATTSSTGGWGFSSNTSTHTLNIPTQNGSQVLGLLNSADWNTFNNKSGFAYPFPSAATSTVLTFSNPPIFSSLTGILKGNGASAIGTASNGTDYTLISATTCGGSDKVSAISASGAITCTADTGSGTAVPLSVETPSGTLNGTNKDFTVANTPSLVTVDGQTMSLTDDYTYSAPTISFIIAPSSTAVLRSYYGGGILSFAYPFPSNATTTIIDLTNSFKTSGLSQGFGYIGSNGLFNTMSSSTIKTSWLTNDSGFTNFTYPFPSAATSTLLTLSGGLTISGGTTDLSASNVKQRLYPAFAYATSTAWTGTTTIYLAPAYQAETWNGVKCETDVGTLNVSFYDGTNRMNMLNASTTIGTFALTTNNSFTSGESRRVDIGTPVTSPTKISCSVDKTIN